MLDIVKTNTHIDSAIQELNTITDGAFKARNLNGLRSLTVAAVHLEKAQAALVKAVDQSTPKK